MIQHAISHKFKNIECFTTTRAGGCSSGNYDSFNLSPYTGDTQENFLSNLVVLADKLQIGVDSLVFPLQVHGNKVLKIDNDFQLMMPSEKVEFLKGADALITNLKGICINVTTADCVPVFLCDAENEAIGVAHAGWKGTCAKIVSLTLEAMCKEYGTNPSQVYAVIGPSISANVYKVGEELISAFETQGFHTEEIFSHKSDGLYLDLWAANHFLLTQMGVPAHQIELSNRCTFTEHDVFFSARRLGIQSGRMLNGMIIR